MAEALFYHLTTQTLERALPDLLRRTIDRGWRAVVRAGSAERVEALDLWLWTFQDESFLPHGTPQHAFPERQPIYLTSGSETPNDPQVLFLVDMADTDDFSAFERVAVMFPDGDEEAKAFARAQWKRAAEAVDAVYWRQDGDGRWKKALEQKKEG